MSSEPETTAWGPTIGEVESAIEWRDRHSDHVRRLLKSREGEGRGYPPSGSDCMHPELWMAPHWRWLENQNEQS